MPPRPSSEEVQKLMERSPLLPLGSDQPLLGQFGCNICGEENSRNSRKGPCAGEVGVLPSLK